LLRQVLVGHPMSDARVHAAWRLSQEVTGKRVEPATIRALVRSYQQDPALVVRRNAYRALVRLRAAGQIVVDGSLHEPRSLDAPVTVGQVRRTTPDRPATRRTRSPISRSAPTDPRIYEAIRALRAAGATWAIVSARTGISLGTLARIRKQAVADGTATKSGGRVTL
jgi:hypothetical protein